jgi:hypothetical protein
MRPDFDVEMDADMVVEDVPVLEEDTERDSVAELDAVFEETRDSVDLTVDVTVLERAEFDVVGVNDKHTETDWEVVCVAEEDTDAVTTKLPLDMALAVCIPDDELVSDIECDGSLLRLDVTDDEPVFETRIERLTDIVPDDVLDMRGDRVSVLEIRGVPEYTIDPVFERDTRRLAVTIDDCVGVRVIRGEEEDVPDDVAERVRVDERVDVPEDVLVREDDTDAVAVTVGFGVLVLLPEDEILAEAVPVFDWVTDRLLDPELELVLDGRVLPVDVPLDVVVFD